MPYRESLGEFFTARCQHLRDSFGTGYCFRQKHYLECGGIPPYPRLMYADDILWLRLLRYGDKITAPEFLFGYRHHPTSTSVEQNADRYRLTLTALRRFTEELARDFPDLVATESGAQALQALIRPALVQIEKGAYRVGLDLNLIREDWAALATRLSADGRAPLQPRQRPFKRAWHALRRGLT